MNILHLSDIHFGRNDPAYGLKDPFTRHDQILDELIETVCGLEPELRPEHIVFTGDIAWHGKRSEFAEAYEWFRKLLDATGLQGKDISFCVGNHDVDWGYRCIDEELTDYTLDKIGRLYEYENVHLLEPSIYAYDEFCRKLGAVPYAYPINGDREYSYSVGYKDIPFACGKTVRLISLNTSLLIAQPGISEDKMWLGQEQLRSLIEYGILPSDESIWYTVILYHHSDRFLHPNETSTYDGRCATLPMMMSYADLLLCGHTESSGRPRLTKQLGGGMLLSAGAAYYNDEHHNAFSMLYLSDEHRTAGFLPYVYNNGWQDYDFEQREIDATHRYDLPQPGQTVYGAVLRLSADEKRYQIPIEVMTVERRADGSMAVENRMDFMSYFSVSADGDPNSNAHLAVAVAPNWKNFLRTRFAWKEYADFLRAICPGQVTGWQLLTKNGAELLHGTDLPVPEEFPFDEELLQKLRRIEFYFDIRLTLPETVSQEERRKIDVLTELAEQEYTAKITVEKTICQRVERQQLQALQGQLSQPGRLTLHSTERCVVTLFGVNIDFGLADVIAGPYCADAEDIQRKLSTFCEGDQRTVSFTAEPVFAAYLIRNRESFFAEHSRYRQTARWEVPSLPPILEYG